ncbi:hypothetical protein [Haloarcula sediminis]|uniref:hypothetical protein n=1 Tax=Haloarcula sediminis TaxID=3111777 RepID=UPI002D76F181|nr:hypothetical protein [Haloarcula sp. CK38]
MQTDAETKQKRTVVDRLSFDTKTAKRVAWSEWEFTVVAPFEIEVCNASYGYLKDEHMYRVMVDQHGIPVSCDCPGFQHYYQPQGKCGKHMLAVAAIGGSTLLDAATAFPPQSTPSESTDTVKTDGGTCTVDPEPDVCPNGNPGCDGHGGTDLECFDCFEIE